MPYFIDGEEFPDVDSAVLHLMHAKHLDKKSASAYLFAVDRKIHPERYLKKHK